MRKTLAPVLALALVLSFALAVLADEAMAAPKNMSCTIKQVDTVSNTITVTSADAKESTFTVDAGAKITIKGKGASLADLKEGQSVRLKVDGKKVVSIEA
jgi:Cu/Ag efflux protein CusF